MLARCNFLSTDCSLIEYNALMPGTVKRKMQFFGGGKYPPLTIIFIVK